jgi:hypothetical protein
MKSLLSLMKPNNISRKKTNKISKSNWKLRKCSEYSSWAAVLYWTTLGSNRGLTGVYQSVVMSDIVGLCQDCFNSFNCKNLTIYILVRAIKIFDKCCGFFFQVLAKLTRPLSLHKRSSTISLISYIALFSYNSVIKLFEIA